jgi:hypothetical protein
MSQRKFGRRVIRVVRAAWIGVALLPAACAARPEAEVLVIDHAEYERTFDAVLEVVRDEGMPAALRDRRAGVIETSPAYAPSLIEPWHGDGSALSERTEHTISFQRRRARFEFTPVQFEPTTSGEQPMTGPDLLSLSREPVDLTTQAGSFEMKVRVYLERAHENGLRRDRWTRGKTTRSRIVSYDDEGDATIEPPHFWTAETRDGDFEQRLMQRVRMVLDQHSEPAASAGTAPPEPESSG